MGDDYYIDETTDESIWVLIHVSSCKSYKVCCSNRKNKPYNVLFNDFEAFHDLIAISQDNNGIKVVFSTPKGAVECYKTMKNDEYYKARLIGKITNVEKYTILRRSKSFNIRVGRVDLCDVKKDIQFQNVLKNESEIGFAKPRNVIEDSLIDRWFQEKIYSNYIVPQRSWKCKTLLDKIAIALENGCLYELFGKMETFLNYKKCSPPEVLTDSPPNLVHILDVYFSQKSFSVYLIDFIVTGFPIYSIMNDVTALLFQIVPNGIELIEFFNFNTGIANVKPYCLVYVQDCSMAFKIRDAIHNKKLRYTYLKVMLLRDIEDMFIK